MSMRDPAAHSILITEQQLRAWLGYERRADLERVLVDNRVSYFRGRGGALCTTLSAIEARLGVGRSTDTQPPETPKFA